MINSIKIENFRCFDKVSIDNFGRINVVVGGNSSGKTAFLEALFLSQMTSPDLIFRLRRWRGLGPLTEVIATKSGFESFWRDLFYKHDQAASIVIDAQGTPENTRRLRAFYDTEESFEVQLSLPIEERDSKGGEQDSSKVVPIHFEITDSAGKKHLLKPEPMAEGFKYSKLSLSSPAAFYSSSFASIVDPGEAANQFSALSRVRGGLKKLRRSVERIFPGIEELSPENFSGVWMLHCLPPGLDEKVPLGLVSSGIQKLVSLLLGIASQQKGIVLIDEVDNGFYYEKLPVMWKALREFAEEYDVQLFASTHSRECLSALLPTIRQHPEDFRLIRLTGDESGKHSAKIFDGKSFEAAIETGTEIR